MRFSPDGDRGVDVEGNAGWFDWGILFCWLLRKE
jgi:hypothetical protein